MSWNYYGPGISSSIDGGGQNIAVGNYVFCIFPGNVDPLERYIKVFNHYPCTEITSKLFTYGYDKSIFLYVFSSTDIWIVVFVDITQTNFYRYTFDGTTISFVTSYEKHDDDCIYVPFHPSMMISDGSYLYYTTLSSGMLVITDYAGNVIDSYTDAFLSNETAVLSNGNTVFIAANFGLWAFDVTGHSITLLSRYIGEYAILAAHNCGDYIFADTYKNDTGKYVLVLFYFDGASFSVVQEIDASDFYYYVDPEVLYANGFFVLTKTGLGLPIADLKYVPFKFDGSTVTRLPDLKLKSLTNNQWPVHNTNIDAWMVQGTNINPYQLEYFSLSECKNSVSVLITP